MGLFKKEKDNKQNKKIKEEKIKAMAEKIKKEEEELDALKDDEEVQEPGEVEEDESPIDTQEPVNEKLTWEAQNVATQTEPVIYNHKDKQVYTIHEALVKILNRLEE